MTFVIIRRSGASGGPNRRGTAPAVAGVIDVVLRIDDVPCLVASMAALPIDDLSLIDDVAKSACSPAERSDIRDRLRQMDRPPPILRCALIRATTLAHR